MIDTEYRTLAAFLDDVDNFAREFHGSSIIYVHVYYSCGWMRFEFNDPEIWNVYIRGQCCPRGEEGFGVCNGHLLIKEEMREGETELDTFTRLAKRAILFIMDKLDHDPYPFPAFFPEDQAKANYLKEKERMRIIRKPFTLLKMLGMTYHHRASFAPE